MECFGTTDFDKNSRLITLSAIIISGLHCISSKFSIPTKVEARAEKWAILVSKIASKLLLLGCM
jgi:hypothetical protein